MKQLRRFFAQTAALGIVLLGLAPGIFATGNATAGKELYTSLCTRCHGERGKGEGPDGATLATKPRNFTDCARMHALNDEDLLTVIKEGGPARQLSKDMPPWGAALQDQQVTDLVAYVRTFCAH